MSRFTLALVILLVSLGMPLVAHADSPQLNLLATQLSGKPTTVVCFGENDPYAAVASGYVWLTSTDGKTWQSDSVIHLNGAACGALQNLYGPSMRSAHWAKTYGGTYDIGAALITITHEATHVALNSRDEGLVECTAYRNVANAARFLPVGWKLRNAIATAARLNHEHFHNAEYRSVC